MRSLTSMLVLAVLSGSVPVTGQGGDAGKVLADMQQALGGAEKVASIKTITAEGTLQRVTARGTIELATELAVQLPDKYVARNQLTDQGNMSIYRRAGFSGEGLINETEAPPNLAATAGARLRTDRAQAAATPEAQAETNRRLLVTAQHEFARLTLALLGTSTAGFPLQFRYAGLAESPDGKAHVIGATGADAFEVRLFVDAATSLPLMLSWSETRPAPAGTAPTPIELRVYYSDFKAVSGVKVPHTWRRSVAGAVTEETTFKSVKINSQVDAKRFEIAK
jgi:hypothetical protein